MKHKLSTTLALVVLTMALMASAARAQTVANGPYYAPPAWDQTLPVATRFIVLSNFASAAVLDRETGLVWEKSPPAGISIWISAANRCHTLNVGNRKGWRLPSAHELSTLLEGPSLPAGHPFTDVQSDNYWSGTTRVDDTASAWTVRIIGGSPSTGAHKTNVSLPSWCVRGGGPIGVY